MPPPEPEQEGEPKSPCCGSCSSSSSGSEAKPASKRARKTASTASTAAGFKGLLHLAISFSHSRPCKCCLCGSSSLDPTPLVSKLDEAAAMPPDGGKRPWAKYRKCTPAGEDSVRVPEGRLCLLCFNVFRALGLDVSKRDW